MTIAPGVGHPDATVFYGGDEAVFQGHRQVLGLLSGHVRLVAAAPGVPTLYGMAVHGTMWGLLNGFLHASALLRSEGVEITRFLDESVADLARESRDRGIDEAFPEFTFSLVSKAVKEGRGDESYSSLVEHFTPTD